MSNWQRVLDIKDAWQSASDSEISPQELAAVISRKLRSLRDFGDSVIDDKKEEIAGWFDCLADDDEATTGDFDSVMGELYDWADVQIDGDVFNAKKVCWVKTF